MKSFSENKEIADCVSVQRCKSSFFFLTSLLNHSTLHNNIHPKIATQKGDANQ